MATDNRATFVLASIRRHSMDATEWHETSIAELRQPLIGRFQLQDGEAVLVSFFESETDWYVFTSQRVFGVSGGTSYEVGVDSICEYEFGQFKLPEGKTGTFALRLVLSDGSTLKLKSEAGKASMAPIYFLRTLQQLRKRAEQIAARDAGNPRA